MGRAHFGLLIAALGSLGLVACGSELDYADQRTYQRSLAEAETSEGLAIRFGTSSKAHEVGLLALGMSSGHDRFSGVCTGTQITPYLVLTAAHCVAGQTAASLAFSLDFTLPFDANDKFVPVESIHVDSRYYSDPAAATLTPDVALIKLRYPNYGRNFPLLAKGRDPLTAGKSLQAIGYGVDEDGNILSRLQGTLNFQRYDDLFYVDAESALQFVTNGRLVLTAGSANQIVCPGDSGGPAFDGDTLAGIVSGGDAANCLDVSEAYFMGVDALSGWIFDQVAKLDPTPKELIVTGPSVSSVNDCASIQFTAMADDHFALVPSDVSLKVQVENGQLYSNSACTVPAGEDVEIPASHATASRYFKLASPGSTRIDAKATKPSRTPDGVVLSGSLSINVGGTAKKLIVDGPSEVVAGACVPYVISAVDAQGRRTTHRALIDTDTSFFTTSDCNRTADLPNLASGPVTLFLRSKIAQTEVMIFRDGAKKLPKLKKSVKILSGALAKLGVGGKNLKPAVGKCVKFDLSLRDAFDNAVQLSQPLAVSLDGGAIGKVYGDAACKTSPGNAKVKAKASAGAVYLKREAKAAGAITVKTTVDGKVIEGRLPLAGI